MTQISPYVQGPQLAPAGHGANSREAQRRASAPSAYTQVHLDKQDLRGAMESFAWLLTLPARPVADLDVA
jgi:hypothetical protein